MTPHEISINHIVGLGVCGAVFLFIIAGALLLYTLAMDQAERTRARRNNSRSYAATPQRVWPPKS